MRRWWMAALLLGSLLPACSDGDDDDEDKFFWSFDNDHNSGRDSQLQPEASSIPSIELRELTGIERRSLRLTLTLEVTVEPGPIDDLGAFTGGEEIPSQMRALPQGDRLEVDLLVDLPAHASRSIEIRRGRRLPLEREWISTPRTLANDAAGLTLARWTPVHPGRLWIEDRPPHRPEAALPLETASLVRVEVTSSGYLRRALRVVSADGGGQELHLDWGGTVIWRSSSADGPLERVPEGVGYEVHGALLIPGQPLERAWDLERLTRRP